MPKGKPSRAQYNLQLFVKYFPDHEDKKQSQSSVVHSHWSRNVEARLSLVEECRGLALIGRELHSDAPPALLCHKEPARASKDFGTQRPNGSLLAPRFHALEGPIGALMP